MKFDNRARLIWILCLAAAGSSSGQVAPAESHEDFICMSGPVKRVVSVFNRNTISGNRKLSCRVDYTKDGETRTLWSSKTDHAYCAAKATLLVTNLVKGNFSCKAETLEPPDEIEPEPAPPATNSPQEGQSK